jgi:hypothetical protein
MRAARTVKSAFLLLTIVALRVVTQTPPVPDSSGHPLPSVVVTADRVPGILGTHAGMVNRLAGDALRRQPLQRCGHGKSLNTYNPLRHQWQQI